jgi:transcriptional repressor NrdR
MVCVYCGSETKVTNSRHQKRHNQVWRRRKCLACGNIFSSLEVVDLSQALMVDKNGRLEPFQREKLLLSIYESLRHRKDAVEAATALTQTIVGQLIAQIVNASLPRNTITEITAVALARFDHAAGVQYTAFHPLA